MEIGYLLNSRVPSDNAHVFQSLHVCDGFADCGHDVTVLYPNRVQIDEDLRNAVPNTYYDINPSIEFEPLWYPDSNVLYSFLGTDDAPQLTLSRAAFSAYGALYSRRSQFDIHYTRGLFIATLLVALGLPTVLELHETSFGRWGNRALSSIGTSQELKGVVTLTEPARDAFVRAGVPADKVYVEPDAVDLSTYEPLLSINEARDRLGLDMQTTFVVYTGSLVAGKGVKTLIEACDALPVELLVVGGRDEERQKLEGVCDERNIENVRFVGQVPPTAVAVYQQAADILVLSPRADVTNHRHNPETTSPLKMFEYMAAERPIVATALPGITDVLDHEENALLVPPGEPKELQRAIDRLLMNEQLGSSLAARAAESVAAYTWKRRCERILAAVC